MVGASPPPLDYGLRNPYRLMLIGGFYNHFSAQLWLNEHNCRVPRRTLTSSASDGQCQGNVRGGKKVPDLFIFLLVPLWLF